MSDSKLVATKKYEAIVDDAIDAYAKIKEARIGSTVTFEYLLNISYHIHMSESSKKLVKGEEDSE